MKKAYKKGIVVSALTTAALLIGTYSFADHLSVGITVPLRDASGNQIPISGPGSEVAYSAKQTCGGCHDYDTIERHSYHAQLGANEHKGWNAWSFGNWPSGAAKGKRWVQSTGHVGKW